MLLHVQPPCAWLGGPTDHSAWFLQAEPPKRTGKRAVARVALRQPPGGPSFSSPGELYSSLLKPPSH